MIAQAATAQSVLLWALVIAPTAAGFIIALRALPWVERLVWARKKPWACDICMSVWSTLLFGGLLSAAMRDPLALSSCGPAYAGCMFVLRLLTEPRGAPPLPELEEEAPS